MPKVSIVTDKGEVIPIKEANYGDVGDAAGDMNGGDFFNFVQDQLPDGVSIAEIRIIMDKKRPIKIKPLNES